MTRITTLSFQFQEDVIHFLGFEYRQLEWAYIYKI